MNKRAAIVPVRPAMRTAQRYGVNPYDNHGEVMARYSRYALMCGAKPSAADVPNLLRRQAD